MDIGVPRIIPRKWLKDQFVQLTHSIDEENENLRGEICRLHRELMESRNSVQVESRKLSASIYFRENIWHFSNGFSLMNFSK